MWLEATAPRWQFGANHWPPITRPESRAEDHLGRRTMVADALAGGASRTESFRAGMVDGVHYLELAEPIKQLKREGRLEEALDLCYAAIAGAEGQHAHDGLTPPPAYTEHAAIILRKLGLHEEEIAVLDRYLALLPADRRPGLEDRRPPRENRTQPPAPDLSLSSWARYSSRGAGAERIATLPSVQRLKSTLVVKNVVDRPTPL